VYCAFIRRSCFLINGGLCYSSLSLSL
jgi:hypothetical protein